MDTQQIHQFMKLFISAVDWHGGHGNPSIDRSKAEVLQAWAHQFIVWWNEGRCGTPAPAEKITSKLRVPIPTFSVELRHPVLDWQTVAARHSMVDAIHDFAYWKEVSEGSCMLRLREATGRQIWTVHKEHTP